MFSFNKRNKINSIIDGLGNLPIAFYKREVVKTIEDIENGNIPPAAVVIEATQATAADFLSIPNWKYNARAMHYLIASVVAECVGASMSANRITAKQFTKDLRQRANQVTQPIFERLLREQVGNDEYEAYKKAYPQEF